MIDIVEQKQTKEECLMGEIQGNQGLGLKSADKMGSATRHDNNHDNDMDPLASDISISIDDIKRDSVLLGAVISGCGSHGTSMSIPISSYDSTGSFIQGVNSLLFEKGCNAVEFEYAEIDWKGSTNECGMVGGEWRGHARLKPYNLSASELYNQ